MKFTDKELLLFDLDGTLIDSAPDLALSVNFMLRSIQREEFPQSIIDSWVGNGASTLVQRALSGSKIVDKNIDDALFEKALSIFLNYYKENLCVSTVAYPNVQTTLQTLQKSGYTLVIVTNKPFDFVKPILEKLELSEFFTDFIGGDSLAKKKPEPEPLLYFCEKFKILPNNSLMIGDSKNDILAAKAANIESVAVNYGYNYGEDISLYSPERIVEDFADILECLI